MRRALTFLTLRPAWLLALALGLTGPRPALESRADEPSTIRLRVRAEDRSGKPVPSARGTLFKMTPPRTQSADVGSDPVIAKAGAVLANKKGPADSAGEIETEPLPGKAAYVLEIHADGFAPELSRWTNPRQSGTLELPPVRLRRLAAIAGTVVDRQGHAIPNVTVIQAGDGTKRLEAVTDGKGEFRLVDVPEGQAIVCFEAAGFRFHGTVLASPSVGARVELERGGEANPRALKLSASPAQQLSREQRLAAVKKMLGPQIDRGLAQPVVDENGQSILQLAARLDPEQVLARLDGLKFTRPYLKFGIQYAAGRSLLDLGKPDAALDLIDKFQDTTSKLQAYLYWFQAEPAKTKYADARRRALAKALLIFDTQVKPIKNRYQFCELGAQFWDAGDHEAARKVFQECQALLDKMPAEGDERESFRVQLASALCRADVERAKKLAADAEPDQSIRVAAEIARQHPKDVEAFLAEVPGDLSLLQLRSIANDFPRLCQRVARQDPAAAERLLLKYARLPQPKTDAEKLFGLGGSFGLNLSKEFIEFQITKLKATCYGVIADAAVAHDPAAARHALMESVELLKPLRAGYIYPTTQYYHAPAVLMAVLVPTAERLDPALAREIFWRALSLRIAMMGESNEREMLDVDTCLLADLVRFYDRPLAESLLDPVLVRTRSRTFAGLGGFFWLVRALTRDSLDRALAFADSLSELPAWNGSLMRDNARQIIASALSYDGYWDSDPNQRLQGDLMLVRSVYGVYVDQD
jgi:Carboxypeptidase regulatory-like domain